MGRADNRGSQKETIIKVIHYIRKYWIYLVLSIMMAAVTVMLTLYLPILTGRVIDLVHDI